MFARVHCARDSAQLSLSHSLVFTSSPITRYQPQLQLFIYFTLAKQGPSLPSEAACMDGSIRNRWHWSRPQAKLI